MGASPYPDHMSLLEARALFFERSELGDDGGYESRWVRVESKPYAVYFPNWKGRVAAARQHDLHHIAAEYETDWPGEAEIAAWEIASGCRHYFAAWLLDLGGMNVGTVVAPRRMWRAFRRGRAARTNLYAQPLSESELARVTVGQLRDELGLRRRASAATPGEVALYALSCAAAALLFEGVPILALLGLRRLLRSRCS
jgi:hypothetical protein